MDVIMPTKLTHLFRLIISLLIIIPASPASGSVALSGPAGKSLSAAQPSAETIEIKADMLGLPLAQDDISALYARPAVLLQAGDSVSFEIEVPAKGDYTFWFDSAAK